MTGSHLSLRTVAALSLSFAMTLAAVSTASAQTQKTVECSTCKPRHHLLSYLFEHHKVHQHKVHQHVKHKHRGPYCLPHKDYRDAHLFYNYYAPATHCGGTPVAMYTAPLPTPPLVGHTLFTYEALLPHEFMYPHHRTYHRYYGRGMNRTKVRWTTTPVLNAMAGARQWITLSR